MRMGVMIGVVLVGCSGAPQPPSDGAPPGGTAPTGTKAGGKNPTAEPPPTVTKASEPTCTATDGRLTITARMDPEVHVDRIPMRRVVLTVRNVSTDPIRVLRVRPEAFRYGTSSLTITVADAPPVFEPEPRPHGYLIGEDDFVLIPPATDLDFEQSFTIDPMKPGAGTSTARREGFVAGATAKITWTFENDQTAFAGGATTLDGVTKPLFGGGPVPMLWTGALSCTLLWTVPP